LNFKNERELQLDLAEYLRNCGLLTYTEIEVRGADGRIDIVAIKPHQYSHKDIRGYEVKLTKDCFLRDNKYENYLDVVNRFYFAAPKGILSKEDIPEGLGLIVRSENGWHVVKAPKRNNPAKLNADAVLSLLYRGYEETLKSRDLRDRIIAENNVALKDKAKNIGWEIAKRLNEDRESNIEEFAINLKNLLIKHMGIEIDTDQEKFYLWDIEEMLESVSGTIREVNNIKKIGEYLQNLNLSEDRQVRRKSNSLKYLRENVLEDLA